jgi:ferric-dicitrate binding protein FerR (iron transport regulator)
VLGEAYFDVAKATGIPFLVKTNGVETRVLGTRFVVKHYGDDRNVQVAVETGKVAVQAARTSPRVLIAGHVADIADTAVSVSETSNISAYTEWVRGQIVFRDTPISEVLSTLSRWYGVQFQIADSSLSVAQVTGSLPYGSLEDMLLTLKNILAVSLSYERQNNGSLVVILRPAQTSTPVQLRYTHPSAHTTSLGR